jgi:hypothetical protein
MGKGSRAEATGFSKRESLPATVGKLRSLGDILNKRQLNPKAPSLIEQELARFSNDQRFVHDEHVMVGIMEFDDSRVLHA